MTDSTKTPPRALARKYRPSLFSEVFHQTSIIETMKNALSQNRLSHAYLFSGTRGTGKTSLARLFAKAINCTDRTDEMEPCNKCAVCQEMLKGSSLDFLEMDGASNRGIDDIRSLLETIAYKPSLFSKKIYLIDEVHMLTKEAFNALLKTLEEPPSHVVFFLATTERHKLPATIISRCQRFELGKIPPATIEKKLNLIMKDFDIDADKEALELIALHSEGSLRDAESILDQMLCTSDKKLTKEHVHSTLGLPEENLFFQIDYAIATNDLSFPFSLIDTMNNQGIHLSYFLSTLAQHYRSLCKQALALNQQTPLKKEPSLPTNINEALTLYSKNHLFDTLAIITKKLASFTDTTLTPMDIEVLLLEIIRSKEAQSNASLVQQLLLLKKEILTPQSSSTAKKVTPKASIQPKATPPLLQAAKPLPKKEPQVQPKPVTPPEALSPPKPLSPPKTLTPPKLPTPEETVDTNLSQKKVLHEQTLWFAAVELGGNLKKE